MVKTLKCLNCGADLQFNPTLQKWKCEWCDSEYQEKDLGDDNLDSSVNDSAEAIESTSDPNIRVYRCSYCGAEVITDAVTSATFCVYCQRPIVLGDQLSGEFKPDLIIPFKNTKDEALKSFKKYLEGKRFLPNAYRDDQNIEKLTGVYIPFWLYNGNVSFIVHGEGDIITHEKRDEYYIKRTDIYNVLREGEIKIDNIPVDASSRTPDDIMDSIEPFDLSKLIGFSTHYLSGFLAERYDDDEEKLYERAKNRMEGSAETRIKDSFRKYSHVRRYMDRKRVDNVSSKYCLLPVWLLYSIFEGKQYIYAMNGQTGKIIGDLPVDNSKIFKFGALVFIISGILCGLVSFIYQLITLS